MRDEIAKRLDPQHFERLHFKLGLALWRAQAFEGSLVSWLVLSLKMPRDAAEEAVLQALARAQRLTLGNLLSELKKAANDPLVERFGARLDAFLEERNWLVHRSFREHQLDLFDPPKLTLLLERLQRFTLEAAYLNEELGRLVMTWATTQGLSLEEIERETRERLITDGVLPENSGRV